MPDGSWKCDQCGNINYPFRTKCNRQNCGADKPAEPEKSPSQDKDENEQVCYVHLICVYSLFEIIVIFVSHLFSTYLKNAEYYSFCFLLPIPYCIGEFFEGLIANLGLVPLLQPSFNFFY